MYFGIKVYLKTLFYFQRQDWIKSKSDTKVVEWRCNISVTKYSKYEWDGLWQMKWIRRNIVEEMNKCRWLDRYLEKNCNVCTC